MQLHCTKIISKISAYLQNFSRRDFQQDLYFLLQFKVSFHASKQREQYQI